MKLTESDADAVVAVVLAEDIAAAGNASTLPAPAGEQDEGVHPTLSGLVDVVVQPQVKHLRKRGGFGAACGSYEGQMAWASIGVTCPDCKKRVRK